MADIVTIATTENKVTIQTVGQDLVTLTSPAADQVAVALGVGPVSLAGQTTDSLGEGSANLYFSNSRASAAAPVQSVSASTGINTLTSAGGAVSITNTKLGTVTGVTMPSGYTVSDSSGALTVAYNNLAAIRTSLGLVPGTSADQIVQMTSEGKLPAVDGSALTNIPGVTPPTQGIANTNTVKIDSTSVADDEYARFTANGLESRSTSEVLGDIGAAASSHTQSATTITTGELGVDRIPALSTDKLTSGTLSVGRGGTGLTSVSTLLNSNTTKNDVGLGNVENTAVSTSITTHNNITTAHGISTFGATLVDDADAASARTTLGVPATNHNHSGGNITSGLVADAYVDLRVDSGVTFDGQGSVIAGSKTVLVPIERACVISAVSIVGDVSGSITVDLQRYTPTGFGTLGSPTTLGSIALSSSQHTRDTTLSGWTKSLSVGDVLSFTTSGTIATVTRVTVKTKLETS